ncbi:MAG: RecQ family ATP-dependent DNA helicase [Planctomycetes bacterium]|nr:RecQ family ATP-dependent DNA helicase [Planctomycetota bacterium]
MALLRERFGFEGFRPGQGEVVAAALAGRDVLCVMPTGAGKSLCYQVPALLLPGVTLVVSPLIALMKDQVDGLRAKGLPAAAVHSLVPLPEQEAALEAAARGECKLLYVAPERFKSDRFRARVGAMRVSLVAVDEAHCISQWGHDFRPDYRRLAPALELLGRPPVLALTATAPREVQDDVVAQLSMRDPVRFVRGIVRENLRFEVVRCRDRDQKDDLVVERAKEGGAVLVYCASRKQVERLHDVLRRRRLPALRYHAGLPEDERTAAQEAFLTGGAPLLVATNAFGMGVDRKDVRSVVHYEIPRTVEAYVQEAGRAGRDGLPAVCTLLFHPGDLRIQRFFVESANPSRSVVADVFRVLREAGDGRLELTADDIAARLHVEAPAQAVTAALAVLDRASVVRRGRREDNRARLRVLPPPGDLFAAAPVPPGLGRLLAWLSNTFGEDVEQAIDLAEVSTLLDRSEETLRRGLARLAEMGRIAYVPPFRGRATEVTSDAMGEDVLAAVDFAALEEKREREERKLERMVGYAQSPGCRVKNLLEAFGDEAAGPCGRCDACERTAARRATAAPSAHERETLLTVLDAVAAHDGRFGFRKLSEHLVGSRAQGMSGRLSHGATYGALSGRTRVVVEGWLHDAHDRGLLSLVPRRLAGDRTVHLLRLTPAGLRAVKSRQLADADA